MRIKILPKQLASRIAAGEVIECPASVVKELAENSIDAGSTRIDVTLIQGGKTRIVVEDDGCGIDSDDLPLALMRHATSKISTPEDLEGIKTLGFRGEALASISAVGRLDIRSRTVDAEKGALIQTEDGIIVSSAEVNCSQGTRMQVDDLFYNLPARRKFLKSSLAEYRRISQILRSLALCHPEINFSLKNDGKTNFSTLGAGSRKEVLEIIWGKEPEIISRFLSEGRVFVECWFQKQPGKKKVKLLSFVNDRVVQEPMLKAAVGSSLGEVAANVALFVAVPPDHVDVNIHPAKTEVRFRYSNEIFKTVRSATLDLVSSDPVNILTDRLSSSKGAVRFGSFVPTLQQRISIPEKIDTGNLFSRVAAGDSIPVETARQDPGTVSKGGDIRFLGQLNMGYLIFEADNALYIMDPHAAHERVIFERIRRRSMNERTVCGLVVPARIPQNCLDDVNAYRKDLETQGFEFLEDNGVLYLKSVPRSLADLDGNPFDYLYTLIEIWSSGTSPVLDGAVCLKWATMACKASIKLTDKLDPAEALNLWGDLMESDNPYACPHGRPTLLEMTENRLIDFFGR